MVNSINYIIENDRFESHVVLNYILYIIGFKGIELKNTKSNLSKSLLYYGKKKPDLFNGIYIKLNENSDVNILDTDILKNNSKNINVDIISIIEKLITDDVNLHLDNDSYDIFDRLRFNSSYQYKNGMGDKPMVNILINFLKKKIETIYGIKGIPLWPNNKKAVIILSHDVDVPIKHSELFNYKLFPKSINIFLRHYYHFFRLLKKYMLDKNKNDFWLFDEIINLEKSFGFKSTFFFAVVNNKIGHELDVDYNINNKKFLKVFEMIKNNGFEIGLHASFNAYKNKESFINEKLSLEHLSQTKIEGLRHHYWHLGKDYTNTINYQNNAGFIYDSSIAFNDNIGFRNNIAFPYPIIYKPERKVLNIIEIPTFCMDGNLFYENKSYETRKKEINNAISVIKEQEGIGAIDWHVRTSYPKNKEHILWGEFYVMILKTLSKDNEIYVTNFKEITKWLKNRKTMLQLSDNKYLSWLV